jgi:hypothetical protein
VNCTIVAFNYVAVFIVIERVLCWVAQLRSGFISLGGESVNPQVVSRFAVSCSAAVAFAMNSLKEICDLHVRAAMRAASDRKLEIIGKLCFVARLNRF